MERKADGSALWYDPQTGERNFFDKEYAKKIKLVRAYRVDNLLFNAEDWNVVRPTELPDLRTSFLSAKRAYDDNVTFDGNAFTRVVGSTRVNLSRKIIDYRKKISSEILKLEQGAKLKDGELRDTASSIKRSIVHAKNEAEADMFLYIASHPNAMGFKGNSELGENKDMGSLVDERNIAKKRKRGVLYYNVYEIERGGETWIIKTEVCRNNTEIPYAIYKKK